MLESFAFPALLLAAVANAAQPLCRSQPGDPSFPTTQELSAFNSSIGGRLIRVVPSAQACKQQDCSDSEWHSSISRAQVPGAMNQVNWEQDYDSTPPSLCFHNFTGTNCGQGLVPIYGVNATTAAHIQAGVRFAQQHNLKVAVKSSGHDYSGRATAKNSLLLWTRFLGGISFHDYQGTPAVTVGPNVGLSDLYAATKAQGKVFVGGTAANVAPAGGYLQGGGHSALAPQFGLAADNGLEFSAVLASGELVTVNQQSHPDLFWAMRGGGGGTWGVVINATFRVFPTFNAVHHRTTINVGTPALAGKLAALHAEHIFDFDEHKTAQYFYFLLTPPTPPNTNFTWTLQLDTFFSAISISSANATIKQFLDAVAADGMTSVIPFVKEGIVNDLVSEAASDNEHVTDSGGLNAVLGSRLIPADVYRHNTTAIGAAYEKLFANQAQGIAGHLVAGGKVSENANVSNAVNPKWRTAKTHVLILTEWPDSATVDEVKAIRTDMTTNKVPVLEALAGPGSGSYANEGDVNEPNFQTTFYGPNYARLTAIKKKYDPNDMFIVRAGVGSERWDKYGLCKIN